jgi:hypothetical protein
MLTDVQYADLATLGQSGPIETVLAIGSLMAATLISQRSPQSPVSIASRCFASHT